MYRNTKKGWYKLLNPEKFIPPADKHMQSFNESEGAVEYKSSLELNAMRYCDFNKHISKWSVEPFAIKYVKPTDGKVHRYYIDLFIEFSSGDKFIVEIKPKSETKPPRKPSKQTQKAMMNYQKAVMTYAVNSAKWNAAKKFAKENNLRFLILTEDELKN